ncbi:MAG TPA: hypothetical protein VEQ41_08430 [Solirubrobacterales bacterium]|nr:hypothetical protein [Solirubrobacterales bacterium]
MEMNMRGRLLIATAVALIGLVFAVGCGDDEDSTANSSGGDTAAETTGGGSDTTDGGSDGESGSDAESEGEGDGSAKSEFVVQANGVCAKRVAEMQLKGQKVFKKIFNDPGPVAAKKLAKAVIVPVLTRELQELKALPQPPEDSKELDAFYAELERIIEYFSGSPDPGTYPYNKAENIAARYGIDKCGTPQ